MSEIVNQSMLAVGDNSFVRVVLDYVREIPNLKENKGARSYGGAPDFGTIIEEWSMKILASIVLCLSALASRCPAQQVTNGNFENGRGSGWIEGSQYTLVGTGTFFSSPSIQPPVDPRSGTWMARLGGYAYNIDSLLQTVTLPNTTPLYLVFYAQTRSSTASECAGLFVGAKVSLIINSSVINESYLCNYNDLLSWTRYYVDVSAIAGTSATVKWKVESADAVWSYLYLDDVTLTGTLDVHSGSGEKPPAVCRLEQNFPNPFNPSTVIRYDLPSESFVTLTVNDMLGREVARLVDGRQGPGYKTVDFSAAHLPSGVYVYRLRAGATVQMRKMILLR